MKKNKANNSYNIHRGEVFYLKKSDIVIVIISNKLHNLLSQYSTGLLISDKNVDRIRESLEVPFELKGKKWKILVSCFNTINKDTLQVEGEFLGKLNEETIDKLDDKIRSILDL